MNSFLREVQRSALRMAEMATGNTDDALEIVQDSMLRLVKSYSERPSEEWRPLFYRILQSRIRDFYRRKKVRARVMVVMPWKRNEEAEESADFMESATAGERENPQQEVAQGDATQAMIKAIKQLPERQKEAFLLRAWEGLSVEETAKAMGCSQGSVKTHYSRAVRSLRGLLEAVRPDPV
jgi:RNA polymerase sigma-70 factor (ECF subfamily)